MSFHEPVPVARRRLEAAITAAINLLDRMDAPGEDLEDEGDWEPWLGIPKATRASSVERAVATTGSGTEVPCPVAACANQSQRSATGSICGHGAGTKPWICEEGQLSA